LERPALIPQTTIIRCGPLIFKMHTVLADFRCFIPLPRIRVRRSAVNYHLDLDEGISGARNR
jgi:hypothetical protein